MNGLRFVWDEAKNTLNKRNHGVSFEESQTVFADENALFMHDQITQKPKIASSSRYQRNRSIIGRVPLPQG